MVIRMTAHTGQDEFLESNFTFVARCPSTGRPLKINPLAVSGAEEEARFKAEEDRGRAQKLARQRIKTSAIGRALDEDGMAAARELLEEARPLLSIPTLASPNDVLIKETRLQNTLTAQPQHRNTAGRIFGGFLMRRAFELAFSTAHLFGGRRPIFHELDEVIFKTPVSVGDLWRLESCVLYTSENMDLHGRLTIHTEVVATVITPETRRAVTSNIFNFTFGMAENQNGSGRSARGDKTNLRRVLPGSQEEAYRVVERYQADLVQLEEDRRRGVERA